MEERAGQPLWQGQSDHLHLRRSQRPGDLRVPDAASGRVAHGRARHPSVRLRLCPLSGNEAVAEAHCPRNFQFGHEELEEETEGSSYTPDWVHATAVSDTQINILWTAPESVATEYEIIWAEGGVRCSLDHHTDSQHRQYFLPREILEGQEPRSQSVTGPTDQENKRDAASPFPTRRPLPVHRERLQVTPGPPSPCPSGSHRLLVFNFIPDQIPSVTNRHSRFLHRTNGIADLL